LSCASLGEQARIENPDMVGTSQSTFAPFRRKAFLVLWSATVLSNIGTWMYNAGSSWLMTQLDATPLTVSLVQVASNLPMFLLALLAGALTDVIDKRRLLITVEIITGVFAAIFATLVVLRLVTPLNLLIFTFLLGVGAAFSAPAWQAIVPSLVEREMLAAAIAANSAGINVSRAIGPALGGLAIVTLGIGTPFWCDAISNLAIIGALKWWRPPTSLADKLPAERIASAMAVGLRHARHNRELRSTLIRALGFFSFASAYWALLPLVARNQIRGGPQVYGLLLGAVGAGAVAGAIWMPWMKSKLGVNRIVGIGSLGTAAALALYGTANDMYVGLLASLVAGLSWVAVLANVNVSAQIALPDWVRGRGVAMLVTVYFGGMTVGSLFWGQLATWAGVPVTLFVAAAGLLLMLAATFHLKLQATPGRDLAPSLHWPVPVSVPEDREQRGPVLVTVEYRTAAPDRSEFLRRLSRLSEARLRDGAYAWYVFEDIAEQGHFIETFMLDSWSEHLRQHRRVTIADHVLQTAINPLNMGGTPKVTHYIAARG
jgi:MFS family permease